MSEATAVLPEPGPVGRASGGRGTRGLVAVGASVLAVVLVAGGGFAAWQFFSEGGPRPAQVLPESTFALVTVDLDPSGEQKVEAIQTLRKFPSWKKRIGTAEDDVMKVIVEKALENSPCKSFDYDDVQPWIGSRAGLGSVLLGDDKPAPVLALQVKDAERAKSGFTELAKCAGVDDDNDFGWTMSGDYILVSDGTGHAEAIASAGRKAPLSSDADFQKWTDEAGGPAIVNAYFGRKGVKVLADKAGPRDFGGLMGEGPAGSGPSGQGDWEMAWDESGADTDTGGGLSMPPRYGATGFGKQGFGPDPSAQITKVLKDFKGAAAGLRFADGGIEMSFAGGGVQQAGDGKVADHVGALPADTAAALALAVPEDALRNLGNAKGSPFGPMQMLGAFTGLDLPQDLIDLLGSSLSISLGPDAPADMADVSGPGDLPIGALINGDEVKIKKVIDKVVARTGAQTSELPVEVSSTDGKVAIATRSDYGAQLLTNGTLGESKNFKDVIENADDAQAILYVSLENGWMDVVRQSIAEKGDPDAREVADNLAVLRAFGASAWSKGDNGYAHIKLALK